MRKRYWLTPPDVYDQLNREFSFDFDPCPYPKPDGFNSLDVEWGQSNFVNPPFRIKDGPGPTAFVRKAIEEAACGRASFLLLPGYSYIGLLAQAGAQIRSMGRVNWHEVETHEPMRNPRHVLGFALGYCSPTLPSEIH